MKIATLCFLLKEEEVLLAMKKRGFGVGKWNGVGGKVSQGETIEEAALRETEEEIGVSSEVGHLENMGNLKFYFKNNPDWDFHVHVFSLKNWQGEPVETEEMKPQWYKREELPFEQMWADDQHWLPLVLAGRRQEGEFYFNQDGSKIENFDLREI